MKINYLFLVVSLVSIVSITYFLRKSYDNKFIIDTKKEIELMHEKRDSLFYVADEVLKDISDNKKTDSLKLNNLDEEVKNKEILIHQQNIKLESLTKKSNQSNKRVEMVSDVILLKSVVKENKINYEENNYLLVQELHYLRAKVDSLTLEIEAYIKEIEKLNSNLNQIKDRHKPKFMKVSKNNK
jgi:hypothetical protein